jgi:hypothetical protein
MNALAYYIKQQEKDGDETVLEAEFTLIEMRELVLVRSERLRKAVESEAFYQGTIGSEGGIL